MTTRDLLLTIDQAAELLGTGPRFPRRLIPERRIRFVHVGRHVRIPESALLAFIASNTVDPVPPRRPRGRGCLMPRKRRVGRVRQLPSGRWQARYLGPDGVDRPADRTFERKADADRWLAKIEADSLDGDWTDPDLGGVELSVYARRCLTERPGLRPKTRQLYDGLLRLHILPSLGRFALVELSPARVRS